jgi:predicted glycoside hydrolase/deacetylase ChbG (UPF0249 family)
MTERVLVVNADDFGRSTGINEGVALAHEKGIVTSASLMVRWPAAEDAAAYSRRASLGVGLHVDLGEWVYRNGHWEARYEVLPRRRPAAVASEVQDQLDRFEQLIGSPPTHLDSHQHVHRDEHVKEVLLRVGEHLNVPVRLFTPPITYSGAFHGQDGRGTPVPEAITVDALVRVIERLKPGVTELGCHPALDCDHESTYAVERQRELETLCHPRVRAAAERCGVALRSFADHRSGWRSSRLSGDP